MQIRNWWIKSFSKFRKRVKKLNKIFEEVNLRTINPYDSETLTNVQLYFLVTKY